MDVSVAVGVAATLLGVVLGSLLGARSQRQLLRDTHAKSDRAARETAYVEYLSACRQFRRYILTEAVDIRLVVRPGQLTVPVIPGSHTYDEAIESARARLDILAGHRPVWAAGEDVARYLNAIAQARAVHPPGGVPDDIVLRAREAERTFAKVAREDLTE